MAGTDPTKIDTSKTALMVIDMQNDFTEKGSVLEIPNTRDGFSKLKEFINACRAKGILIIYTRHTYSPEGNPIEARLFPKMDTDGLRKDSHGWEVNDYLKPEGNDIIINKNRYDAFYQTSLDDTLKEKGITDIIVTGTMTEVCCDSTAKSAMYRNYAAYMVSDLNFTRDQGKHEYALKTFASNFGWVLESSEILKLL